MSNGKIQKQNVGNAGEYYIAARLSALNFTVTITLGRAETYDILAVEPAKGEVIKVSVKTTQDEHAQSFALSAKDDARAARGFYYAFVRLNGFKEQPDFWIIPSTTVCPLIAKAHKRYLKTPGKNGKCHADSTLRKLFVEEVPADLYPDWTDKVPRYHNDLGLKQLLS